MTLPPVAALPIGRPTRVTSTTGSHSLAASVAAAALCDLSECLLIGRPYTHFHRRLYIWIVAKLLDYYGARRHLIKDGYLVFESIQARWWGGRRVSGVSDGRAGTPRSARPTRQPARYATLPACAPRPHHAITLTFAVNHCPPSVPPCCEVSGGTER